MIGHWRHHIRRGWRHNQHLHFRVCQMGGCINAPRSCRFHCSSSTSFKVRAQSKVQKTSVDVQDKNNYGKHTRRAWYACGAAVHVGGEGSCRSWLQITCARAAHNRTLAHRQRSMVVQMDDIHVFCNFRHPISSVDIDQHNLVVIRSGSRRSFVLLIDHVDVFIQNGTYLLATRCATRIISYSRRTFATRYKVQRTSGPYEYSHAYFPHDPLYIHMLRIGISELYDPR